MDIDVKVEKSKAVIIDLLSESILPLFNKYIQHISKFDSFFNQRSKFLSIDGTSKIVENLSLFEENIIEYWDKWKPANSIICSNSFIKLNENIEFNLQQNLFVEFEQFHYTISTEYHVDKLLRHRYQQLTDEEIDNIIVKVITIINNKIESEIDKSKSKNSKL